MKLVAGQREIVGLHLANVNFDFARRLNRVAVEQHPTRPANLCNPLHRKQHARFIVRPHQRNDGGVVRERGFKIGQLEQAVAIHRQIGDAVILLFQRHTIIQHGRMFDSRSDDMAFLRTGLERRMNRSIVALGGATGENHFARICANQIRDLRTRRLNHCLQLRPELVAAGRITPFRLEIGQHRLQHFRQNRRRCVVVQVYHYFIW